MLGQCHCICGDSSLFILTFSLPALETYSWIRLESKHWIKTYYKYRPYFHINIRTFRKVHKHFQNCTCTLSKCACTKLSMFWKCAWSELKPKMRFFLVISFRSGLFFVIGYGPTDQIMDTQFRLEYPKVYTSLSLFGLWSFIRNYNRISNLVEIVLSIQSIQK